MAPMKTMRRIAIVALLFSTASLLQAGQITAVSWSGKFQGYFIEYTGKRKFFIGTTSRTETIKLARHLEAEHRQMALGAKPLPASPAEHRKRPFLEVIDEYIAWGRAFGRTDGKG